MMPQHYVRFPESFFLLLGFTLEFRYSHLIDVEISLNYAIFHKLNATTSSWLTFLLMTTKKKQLQQNFPIKSSESAYIFMQHFVESLKGGGRAAIAIKNTFLNNTDGSSIAFRKQRMDNCNHHTILDYPYLGLWFLFLDTKPETCSMVASSQIRTFSLSMFFLVCY